MYYSKQVKNGYPLWMNPYGEGLQLNHSYKSHKLRDKKLYIVAFFAPEPRSRSLELLRFFVKFLKTSYVLPTNEGANIQKQNHF